MKGLAIYAVVVSVVAVGAIGVAVGFVVSRATDDNTDAVQATAAPTERPQPQATEYVPRLTATEAAAKARSHFLPDPFPTDPDVQRALLAIECSTTDFNQRDLAWIVVCELPNPRLTITYKVSDATGAVTGTN